MIEKQDLLIEIGTEEMPPKALLKLALAFAREVQSGLANNMLNHGESNWFATPRRLALLVSDLDVVQADREELRRGPALSAAYDNDGNPTKAAEGFARSCGVRVEDLETIQNSKGDCLAYRVQEKGKATADLLAEIIETALSRLPIPKRMRWGESDVEFVRPVHWVLLLFGSTTVEGKIMGVATGNTTQGHHFHHPHAIVVNKPLDYANSLEKNGWVIADYEKRRELIKTRVMETARNNGGHALIDLKLLDEVTSLVEWPVVFSGSFDSEFLQLPREVLIATMQDHQKYFPVTDDSDNLLPVFIAVSNIDSPSPDIIRRGNERVIRPRLSDAAFFWKRDCDQPLANHIDGLKQVIFQQALGSLHDKAQRVVKLAAEIAAQLGIEPAMAERASQLSKCDLLTEMVGEFPELQGVMGRYYAGIDGEPEEVVIALDEQYMPRYAGDHLPQSTTGQILSIADKLDSLTGIFAIGQAPSGDKDPFALRRAALGTLRIMIECELDLDLEKLLGNAATGFDDSVDATQVTDVVFDFMMERLRHYYLDAGTNVHIFEAVLALRPARPHDFHHRILAVTEFCKLPAAESLAIANKRISNILKKADSRINESVDKKLLREQAEQKLASAVENVGKRVKPMLEKKDYGTAMTELAGLRESVDVFFDDVMVMCDDDSLKNNRLALLRDLRSLFMQTADISRLQG
jgi:glycyl-tRNA synthetase beta chain